MGDVEEVIAAGREWMDSGAWGPLADRRPNPLADRLDEIARSSSSPATYSVLSQAAAELRHRAPAALVRRLVAALEASRGETGATESGWSVYVASKTKYAPIWLKLRRLGEPIISTWIDEAGAGETADFGDLWTRCVDEVARATAVVAYYETGDEWKGAFVEVGAALALGKPVYLAGDEPPERWTFKHHPLVTRCSTTVDALRAVAALALAPSVSPTAEAET